jgi:hypothetical protein
MPRFQCDAAARYDVSSLAFAVLDDSMDTYHCRSCCAERELLERRAIARARA